MFVCLFFLSSKEEEEEEEGVARVRGNCGGESEKNGFDWKRGVIRGLLERGAIVSGERIRRQSAN